MLELCVDDEGDYKRRDEAEQQQMRNEHLCKKYYPELTVMLRVNSRDKPTQEIRRRPHNSI
jgi:hypothetical protein